MCQKLAAPVSKLVIVVALVGCATPAERFDARARSLGFERVDVDAGGFRVATYRRPGAAIAPALHVYLEGDGTPWLHGREIAADPTPRRPFALELAARDRDAVMVLGRPCYHGHAVDDGCDSALWTSARYGERVVASVEAALSDAPRVTLVGYSGGGVLARLVAERAPNVDRVITVAANLDVAAWARQHGYAPLDGSLDPALRSPLAGVIEVNLVGARDANVPPDTLETYASRNPNAQIVRFPDYDHRCCWIDAWPQLLAQFAH